MKDLGYLEPYRIQNSHMQSQMDDDFIGAYLLHLKGAARIPFLVLVSVHDGEWEHVSVSTEFRCPRWDDMKQVKELFFFDDETVMQLHPPKKDYVNSHPYCLHLWRPIKQKIPMPDTDMV